MVFEAFYTGEGGEGGVTAVHVLDTSALVQLNSA